MSVSIVMVRSRKSVGLEGSPNVHLRIPKLFISFLIAFHLGPSGDLTHIPIIVSIKRRNKNRCAPHLGIRVPILCTVQYIVAHMQAAEVLMAVPSSCKEYMSPHSKMLLHITMGITYFTISRRKHLGRVRLSSQRVTTWTACLVSMCVYIDIASAVNSQEFGKIFQRSLILASRCALSLV